MAEEFGDFTLKFEHEDKEGRKGFEGSYLRVWHKVEDSWKVDASFMRPNQSDDKK